MIKYDLPQVKRRFLPFGHELVQQGDYHTEAHIDNNDQMLIHPILSQTESPEVFLCFPSSRPKGSVGLPHKGEPILVINKIATAGPCLVFVTPQPILTMLDKVYTFDLAIGFFNMFLHLVDLSENELSLLNHINSHVLR